MTGGLTCNLPVGIKLLLKRVLHGCPRLFGELRFWYWLNIHRRGSPHEEELSFLPELVAPGTTAVDVGAHCGRYTLPLSKLVGTEGCVIAFEPVASNFMVLRRLKDHCRLANVVLYDMALGERPGRTFIRTPVTDRGEYFFSRSVVGTPLDGNSRYHSQEVRIETLDRILADGADREIGYVKCDVEGYELPVLRGGENLLRRYRPVVQCEIIEAHERPYGYGPGDLVAFMEGLGYGLHACEGESIAACGLSPRHYNYLFIPRG